MRAAAVVRTLAAVAIRMPKKPASAEQAAPTSIDRPMSTELSALPELPQASSAAATSTKTASTRYSRPRKAMAPSRMWPAIVRMVSVPASWRPTQELRNQANARPARPVMGIRYSNVS